MISGRIIRKYKSDFKRLVLIVFITIPSMMIVYFVVGTYLIPPSIISGQISTDSQSIKITNSIEQAKKISDPYIRELFIISEAKKLKITTNDYEKLINSKKKDLILSGNEPTNPINIFKWVSWFWHEIPISRRLEVLGNKIIPIVHLLSSLSIIYAIIRYWWGSKSRSRQTKYQAWLVIHAAQNKKISGARIAAFEELQEQRESFRGLILEEGAELSNINLQEANLIESYLCRAILEKADLMGADLTGANLREANLRGADLTGAILDKANLTEANLSNVKLIAVDLTGAIFKGANLTEANLTGANLTEANLTGANLTGANLTGANLTEANLIGADRTRANFTRTFCNV